MKEKTEDKIDKMIVIAAILVIAVILTAAFVIIVEHEQPEKREVVMVIDIETATVTFRDSGDGIKEKRSMPYIIAKNNKGETIMGVMDVTGFVKGDKIVIAESRGYCEDDGYKWYRFVGYHPIIEEHYGE